jgi:tetratricopeptide (TPR) repeat protein
VSTAAGDRPVNVHAEASGGAQQAVLGQGVQNNYFYAAPESVAAAAPVDTLVPPPMVMVGRAEELVRLYSASQDATVSGSPVAICTVYGMGGAGKTALARALAAQVADDFPDARIEVDLYGFTPGVPARTPGEVLGELLVLVGVRAADIPSQTEGRRQLWRSWLSTRRVMLLLDNARNAAQVDPLLPGGGAPGRCLVLVTSRNRLVELDATTTVAVDVLPVPDAVTLLVRAGRRTAEDLHARDSDLQSLARLCGCLPLALRAVGNLLARLDPEELIEVMRSAHRPLEHIAQADQAAATAFTVSYDVLPRPLQDLLRACSWHPGPDFDAASIADLVDRPRPLVTVQLVDLLNANMLTGLPQRRYTFLDLFLGYTRDQADIEDDAQSVRDARLRLYSHLQARLDAAARLVFTDNQHVSGSDTVANSSTGPDQSRDWLSAASDELTTAALTALGDDWDGANHLAKILAYWLHACGKPDKAMTIYTALASRAATTGDRKVQADALSGLGGVFYALGNHQQAQDAYRQAHDIYAQLGDTSGQADTLKGLGDVLRLLGDYLPAEEAYQQAHDRYQDGGDTRGQVDALTGQGELASARGNSQRAQSAYQQAHDLAHQIGYRSGQADALCGLGEVALGRDEQQPARDAYQQAHDIYQQIGNQHGLAYALKGQGNVALLSGDHDLAREVYRQALDLYEQIGFRNSQADVLRGLGDVDLARHDLAAARICYQQAQDLSHRIGYRNGEAAALRGLGNTAHASGDIERARNVYQAALDLYTQTGNLRGQTVTAEWLENVDHPRQ